MNDSAAEAKQFLDFLAEALQAVIFIAVCWKASSLGFATTSA